VKATQTIDIQCFVSEDEIPVEYFETPYYLAPAARGQKVYALLRETLQASKRIAIAQVVIRTTQHLAAIVVKDRALMLNTLRYHDELVDPKGLDLPAEGLKAAGVSPKEVQLAKRLIDDMTEHWKPEAFKDTYHEDLMARIKEKIKLGQTQEITEPEGDEAGEPRLAPVVDLAALLRESLARKGGDSQAKSAPRKAAATRTKPHLRVVASERAASRTAARRKRA
jgi:DNA end-binding protein Ku